MPYSQGTVTPNLIKKTFNVSIKVTACNLCCCGKAIGIIYSECVSVALGIQHAHRMRRILLSSVACLLHHIFPHYVIIKDMILHV